MFVMRQNVEKIGVTILIFQKSCLLGTRVSTKSVKRTETI